MTELEVHVSLRLDAADERRCREVFERAGLRGRLFSSADELARGLGECRFLLLGRPLPEFDFSAAKRLDLLQLAGSGVDPLFPARGLRAEAMIANCRGLHADAVRDHVLALLLALARDVPRALAQQRERRWAPFAREAVSGKKLVLLGFGAVGARVARAANALGMVVTAVRRSERAEPELARVYPPSGLVEAVSDADFLVVAVPLTSETRGVVSAEVLSALPERAAVINVSRGGVLDERALEAALRAGRLAGAALDVFEHEPLPAQSTLWDCPGLVVTPHVAGYEPAYLSKVFELFAENVRRVERGEAPLSVVSRELEY